MARTTARGFSRRSGSTLADVPPDRVAGAIFLTDGRVHDVPAEASALGFSAPVHALVTGRPDERDRRVALVTAPRFGIVNQSQVIAFKIEDSGYGPAPAQVTIRRDGETIDERTVRSGDIVRVPIPIPHAGPNIVEIETSPLEGELTTVNNRAVVSIDGVRDKLRVLLVSGEPHAGERTWRNLLKSRRQCRSRAFHHSASAGKAGRHADQRTVADRLPDARVVQQKINEFQLIIFDRYARQGVLPIIYFEQHRTLCPRRRRGAGRSRPGLRLANLDLAHAA